MVYISTTKDTKAFIFNNTLVHFRKFKKFKNNTVEKITKDENLRVSKT